MIALLINVFETNLSIWLEWRINYIIDISNLLVVFNSSFNFIIYYNFSKQFQTKFLDIFFKKTTKKIITTTTTYSPLNVVINHSLNNKLIKQQNNNYAIKTKKTALVSINNQKQQQKFFEATIKKNPALRLKNSTQRLIDISKSPRIHLSEH